MRVLFVTYSEKAHFLAMVPVAWALRTAGHEVRVASQPALTDTITAAGLTAVPVGRDHTMWRSTNRFLTERFAQASPKIYEKVRWGRMPPFDIVERPEDVTRAYLQQGYKEVVPGYRMANEPMLADLVALCLHWRPDLVIWEPATYAAPIAAKACGAAHARLLWSLDFFGLMRRRFLELAEPRQDALADWLGARAAEYGTRFSEDLTTGHLTIDPFPPSMRMDTALPTLPVRYIPYNGRAVVPRWLWEPPERPRVALTLGISATERFGGYPFGVQEILDSLADLDIELVATLPDREREKLDRVPANTRIVPFAPLHALVPTCAAVIHHAGFGTLFTTTVYGSRQLAVPEQEDAAASMRRLTESGAALAVHATRATGERIRADLLRLLREPSFGAEAARRRAELLAMPTPNDAVPELERLAAAGRERARTDYGVFPGSDGDRRPAHLPR